jgi:hypothetical protein
VGEVTRGLSKVGRCGASRGCRFDRHSEPRPHQTRG